MKWCISPTSLTLSCVLLSWVCAPGVRSQVIPDDTLPTPTQVTIDNLDPSLEKFNINGGTQAGGNLFHSFREFSVPKMGEAFFNNAADVQNIFSRVTGGSVSDIQGVIRANVPVNLFLLNPAGIVFGPDARLDIGGSFFGSTADSVVFSDNVVFSATDTNTPPLLTINVPIGLQFGAAPGDIQVQGNGVNRLVLDNPTVEARIVRERTLLDAGNFGGLSVSPGRTLGLVGGNITFSGGLIQAPEGRIELGSVGAGSRVDIGSAETGFPLSYAGVQNFQDIGLAERAGVFATGDRGGDIQVRGRNLTLTGGSEMTTLTLGSLSGGSVTVNASGSISLIGESSSGKTTFLGAGTFAAGNSGNVNLSANELIGLRGSSQISAVTQAGGRAGNVTLSTGSLTIQDGSEVSAFTTSTGNAGMVTIRAADLVEISGIAADGESFSVVGAASTGEGSVTGNAGNVTIKTRQLIARDGGNVVAFTNGTGNAGDIRIDASQSVELSGTSPVTNSGLLARTRGTGNAGNITINTPKLTVRDEAVVVASTEGSGNAGRIEIQPPEGFELDESSVELLEGGALVTGTSSEGLAGNVEIDTGRFVARDGSGIITVTGGSGQAGEIEIDASESVELTDSGSGLIAWTLAQGDAGTIEIDTEQFNLKDEAFVSVASFDLGQPGTIEIEAERIFQENNGSLLAFARLGRGGNITLEAEETRLEGLSNVLAFGFLTQEGNIDITSDRLLLFRDGSRVITLDADPEGGNINVSPRDEQFLILLKCNSCIISASGTLLISDELPVPELAFTPILDVNSLIRDDLCKVGVGSEFIISGAGGIPQSPLEPLSGDGVVALDWVEFLGENPDVATVPQPENTASEEEFPEPEYKPLVEAQGWIVGENGQIFLVANSPTVTPAVPALNRIDCTHEEEE